MITVGGRVVLWLTAVFAMIWTAGALYYCGPKFAALGPLTAGLALIGFGLGAAFRKTRKAVLPATFILFAGTFAWWLSIAPSNDRVWTPDQQKLPWAETGHEQITVHNIRNCRYRSASDYTVAHYDKTWPLKSLEAIDFIVVPFTGFESAAHTFVSFRFGEKDFLSISIEVRKEEGESYGVIPAMFKQYEIMYVAVDERDAIQLRTHHHKDDVLIYPVKATADQREAMLLSMLHRMNKLKNEPEYYHTLANTCTSNLVDHVNLLVPGQIPFSWKTFLTGYSEELAYDLGMINTELGFEEARAKFRVNDRSLRFADDPDYSIRLRDSTWATGLPRGHEESK